MVCVCVWRGVSWFSLSVLRLVVDYMTSSQRFAWQVLVSLGWECKNDPPHTVGPQTIRTALIFSKCFATSSRLPGN